MKHTLFKVPIVICVLLVVGCSQAQPTPIPPTEVPASTVPATIKSLEILTLAGDAKDVRALVRGELPDGCYQVDAPKVAQEGDRFEIELSGSRPAGATCPASPVEFERVIPLAVAGLEEGEYQVVIGSSKQAFSLSAPESTLVAQEPNPDTPTPEPPSDNPAPTPEPPGPQPTQQTAGSASAGATGCEDKAAFYKDVTIPDNTIFEEGEEFVKTWRIRNEGTCTWSPDYQISFAGGDAMNAPISSPMPQAAPGDIVDISVPMRAPTSGGAYTGFWEFISPSGNHFGVHANKVDKIWVKIAVKESDFQTVALVVTGPSSGCELAPDDGVANTLLGLINGARRTAGFRELSLQSQLTAAALAHSRDMACNDFLDHVGTDGKTWRERIKAQGYNYSAAAENIYVGNPSFGGGAQGAFDWWMNSQIHRDNILNRKVSQIGIAYVYLASSQYGGYYTLVFANP